MTTIDQRVLIPASPNIIWKIVSQIENNPSWQVDCRSVHFLSSRQEGRGTRWRQMTASGREYIMEIAAWYDMVGYEYRIVEGGPFHEAIGRIKLHETPDGTVVHWEFIYEIGGFMGGLRNSLMTRRNLENLIADSLWALWEISNQARRDQPVDYVYRSLMRAAPDVQKRAQYMAESVPSNAPSSPIIPEPPVQQEDTRPRESEPEQDTAAPLTEVPTSVLSETEDAVPVVDDSPSEPITAAQPLELTYLDEDDEHADLDTSKVSVFEVFGLTPPSQAEPPTSPVSEMLAAKSTREVKPVSLETGRNGLRARYRNRLAIVRKPK